MNKKGLNAPFYQYRHIIYENLGFGPIFPDFSVVYRLAGRWYQ